MWYLRWFRLVYFSFGTIISVKSVYVQIYKDPEYMYILPSTAISTLWSPAMASIMFAAQVIDHDSNPKAPVLHTSR